MANFDGWSGLEANCPELDLNPFGAVEKTGLHGQEWCFIDLGSEKKLKKENMQIWSGNWRVLKFSKVM